ncbi:hypothetical protein R3W88_033759 [Solanum pinnatisectum]|uniref:Uncharacterized protein n=1 Tax=Solanum pinnatisectum TaxID=50273 RepID=A0AAV9K1R9_9SOLN|nr:hypothetical protein R3W88_033759 [Solanum pinnatisectum]
MQAPMLKNYLAKLSLTSFTCFFGLIQLLAIAAFTERDPTHWKIQSREETWCIQKGGPVYVASFQPVILRRLLIMFGLYLSKLY